MLLTQREKALRLTEADFAPTVWQGGIYHDKRYGIPLDMHPLGFYYNKAVMRKAGLDPEKPPTTRSEYEAALTELEQRAPLQTRRGGVFRDEPHVGPTRASPVHEQQARRDARHERPDEQPPENPASSSHFHDQSSPGNDVTCRRQETWNCPSTVRVRPLSH